ncbi:beta-1,4-glucuronyltransferase 1 isoform X2 [Rhineura floridana]|uniref:beta-1,4-glucuronyltransferase 1 isoform X2 n=1 Tax=Rhineura floridana TaxID=261503 RepID=UPI002AC874CD|nr:beta-1,4-glucuronyltransferase 1 isoform X2 [Rhineura floridana]XP_061462446.1 beta-1,4-glucuronyltransferase 1 isoform X2 [Rhineura floridana]
MHCSCFQVLVAALALVAGLQLLYLALLSGLHGQEQRSRYAELFQGRRPLPSDGHKERLKRVLASGGALDASGQYRIYRDLLLGSWDGARSQDVVLVTHTSLGNLHHAQRLAERWQGPISVALFAPGSVEVRLATAMVYALAALCAPIRQLVRLHLVCHADQVAAFPELQDHGEFAHLQACVDVFAKLARLAAGRRNYAMDVANASYPNNLLRNVAREAVGGHWMLVVDMDMVPSEGLREAFLALPRAADEERPGVFVVPAFEIRHTRRIPGTKTELLQLYQVGEIRPFYEELCSRCQAPTNYSHWLNLPVSSPLRVAYEVEWQDPWEPFYIAASSVPLYDERFKQYGFNRISQARKGTTRSQGRVSSLAKSLREGVKQEQ